MVMCMTGARHDLRHLQGASTADTPRTGFHHTLFPSRLGDFLKLFVGTPEKTGF
jgi:hypothetical protein